MTTATASSQRFATSGGAGAGAGKGGKGAKDTEPEGAAKAGRLGGLIRSKKFIIAVVLLLVAGGAAYKILTPTKPGPPVGGEIVPMDATTLNLAGGHYLKLAISIQLVKGKATAADFPTSHAAEITIDEFSNHTLGSLPSNPPRKWLEADLLVELKAAHPGEVYNAFVTQFVTQ